MDRFKTTVLTAAFIAVVVVNQSYASPLTYSGYSVLDNQNVVLSDPLVGLSNESGGSGQITLTGTNTAMGSIATWCVDILHFLQGAGSFGTGTFLGGTTGGKVNALLTNAVPALGTTYDASSALQIAIWKVEYGSGLTVSAPTSVLSLADSYLTKVDTGLWTADPAMRVAVLTGGGVNQDQAYLTPVPEPASMALVIAGLFGLGLVRRKQTKRPQHQLA